MAGKEDLYFDGNKVNFPEQVELAARTVVQCNLALEGLLSALYETHDKDPEGTLIFFENGECPTRPECVEYDDGSYETRPVMGHELLRTRYEAMQDIVW